MEKEQNINKQLEEFMKRMGIVSEGDIVSEDDCETGYELQEQILENGERQ